MEVGEMLDKISSMKEEIYNYVVNTDDWLFYWIANKEVQDFIREYPEDYEDRVHLQVKYVHSSPLFQIQFDEHPSDIESIERYGVLATFRDSVKAKWLEWNGEIRKMQIKEKEKELTYFRQKVIETEKEIDELRKLI